MPSAPGGHHHGSNHDSLDEGRVNVTVRVFASYADALGGPQTTVSVPEPATVGAIRTAVAALSPALPPRPIIAVNEVFATDDVAVHPGDDVAVIPPVAGG